MKYILALGIALAAVQPAPAPAADAFSDPVCPEATQPVRDHNLKAGNANSTVDDVIAATQRVIDAYDRCVTQRLADGHTEDAHYAQLRGAQYHYEVGHWQGLLGNKALARQEYDTALKLVNPIIDWQASNQPYYASNNVNIGSGSEHRATSDFSLYKQPAIEVRDSTQKALALLNAPPTTPYPTPVSTGK